jgi:ornithine cyclodeaminase/alanine dehydrogenase-like protein (mu-crystallin family)
MIGHAITRTTNMTATRILDVDAVHSILDKTGSSEFLSMLIGRLRTAFETYDPMLTTSIDRTGFHYTKPNLGLVEWMPTMEAGTHVAVKTVGYHPTNPVQRSTPSVLSSTAIYDTTTGALTALVESTLLTALRTGAASALASETLSITEATTVGVVGCGAQAVTQLHALSLVRPITRVIAFDTDPSNARSLASRVAFLGLDIEIVETDELDRLVDSCDILVTATSVDPGSGPVVPDTGTQRPWLHVNAVGADFMAKIEVPRSQLIRSLVVPDVTAQCLIEGESQQLEADQLGPDLPTLVKAASNHEIYRDRLTVFDSTGWAVEDLVVAELTLDIAREFGLGTETQFQASPTDPYDPYS